MKKRQRQPHAHRSSARSRAGWQRLGALLVFLALVLGQTLLPAAHDDPADHRSAELAQHDHDDDVGHDPATCPHEGEHEHDPSTCGICKQLFLAKSLVSTSEREEFIVEFVEVPDGRVIGLVHRAKPELATAPPRGPPAADL